MLSNRYLAQYFSDCRVWLLAGIALVSWEFSEQEIEKFKLPEHVNVSMLQLNPPKPEQPAKPKSEPKPKLSRNLNQAKPKPVENVQKTLI